MPEEYKLIVYADNKSVSGHFYTELRYVDSNGNITSNFFGLNQTLDETIGLADFVYDDGVLETNTQLASRQFGNYTTISKSIRLTANQYNDALLFGNNSVLSPGIYEAIGHNCVDYVQNIYSAAGQPGHFAFYYFTESELNSIGPAGGYANNKYGHSDWFSRLGDSLLDLSNYVDSETNELKDSTKAFYKNLVESFVNSDNYSLNKTTSITSLFSQYNLTFPDLAAISGNSYLTDRLFSFNNNDYILTSIFDELKLPITFNTNTGNGLWNEIASWANTVATGMDYAKTLRSPLVLDLNGNGIELKHVDNGVYFDIDKDGFAEKVGWVKGTDGLLAMDRNGNGIIDNITELYGDDITGVSAYN